MTLQYSAMLDMLILTSQHLLDYPEQGRRCEYSWGGWRSWPWPGKEKLKYYEWCSLASFPVSTPSFFSACCKSSFFLQHAKKNLGVETGNEASVYYF